MSRRLIVGLGNPLAGDDGFGPAVLRHLDREGSLPEDVALVPTCTDLLGLLDVLERYETVVLVDALVGGDRPAGQVAVLEESTLLTWRARSTSVHRLSPVEALRVFRTLHPEAKTTVTLVALHTDATGPEAVHARPDTIGEGARLVRAALGGIRDAAGKGERPRSTD